MSEVQWFYSDGGRRKGPFNEEAMSGLVKKGAINTETPVWRAGLSEWVPLRSTAFSEVVSELPPPLTQDRISNFWAWLIAVWPWLLLGLMSVVNERVAPATVAIWIVSCIALVVLDVGVLRAAGHTRPAYRWAVPLLIGQFYFCTIYLYLRQRRISSGKAVVAVSTASSCAILISIWYTAI